LFQQSLISELYNDTSCKTSKRDCNKGEEASDRNERILGKKFCTMEVLWDTIMQQARIFEIQLGEFPSVSQANIFSFLLERYYIIDFINKSTKIVRSTTGSQQNNAFFIQTPNKKEGFFDENSLLT